MASDSTTLGKAYVQIMPSAKGISGSIQKAVMPEAKTAGKKAGSAIATNISKSMGSVGKKLTKSITVPVAGAVTAVGSLVGALGFKRLVGLDTAQAKLKGLGYDAKEVERISGQVETAIMDGMTTMGEGVDIAAGALAAGVMEGAELEKYIKLVGDAAVGANRPVDEMAQIFNRVQGQGKLMTQELNMIEMGLPGFEAAMSKSLGVTREEFKEMVTAGEVSSDQFLNVMDDFAGGMASAYSDSWAGMAKNVLAYVGIIGESLLEGLFKDGKEGLANFIEVLQSETVKQWAQETGEKIREFAHKVVDGIKNVIDWWKNLSDGTKDAIKAFGLFAVAAGPILMVISKIVGLITPLITIFKTLGIVIGAITSPIGLVVAAIVTAAALVIIYWEPIKEFFINLWESIKEITLTVWESIKEMWFTSVEFFKGLWQGTIEFFMNIWNTIKNVFVTTWTAIMEFITPILETLKTIIFGTWDAIKQTISVVLTSIKSNMTASWNNIKTVVTTVTNAIKTVITTVWNAIKSTTSKVWNGIKSVVSSIVNAVKSVISSVFNAMKSVVTSIWNAIKGATSSVWNGIKGVVSGVVNGIKSTVTTGFNAIKSAVTSVWNGIKSTTKSVWDSMVGIVKAPINLIINAINAMINGLNKIKIKSPKIPSWVPKFGGKGFEIGFNIPNVPSLDVGTNLVEKDGLAMIHEGEAVVPKKYNPAVGGGNDKEMLEVLQEQNKLITRLLHKNQSIYLDRREVGKTFEGPITSRQDLMKYAREAFN